MNAAELLKMVIAYGADADGIRDRFGRNAELYELCFRDFLEEPNFEALEKAMAAQDYSSAFEAAHALKGLSGNLGLCGIYDVICVLVESLRAKSYDHIEAEYAEVRRQYNNLVSIFAASPSAGTAQKDEALPPIEAAMASSNEKRVAALKEKNDNYMTVAIAVICTAILLLSYLFSRMGVTYRENIVRESGEHLMEMSNQIKLYIEEQVSNDWKIARSVGDSIMDSNYRDDDEAILGMMQRKQEVWGVSDLMLYTEDGYCIYSNGSAEANDIASDTIVKARETGKYLSVIDSRITYTVPLQTSLAYHGSAIVAVSVVQEMATFLDDMNFSSFDEAAWMYLTDESGVVISTLTNDAAVPTFNFRSLISHAQIMPLSDEYTADSLLTAQTSEAFLVSDNGETNYVVSVPIYTGATPLRLYYLAPEEAVNNTMNGFSQQLTAFSLLIVFLFSVLAFLTFMFIYRSRKKLFDKAIMARERMFDLLAKNTRTAFGLFVVNQTEPSYISGNAKSVIGDRYWVLTKDEKGYHMHNDTGTTTDVVQQANEMLRGWDGKSVFKSSYLRNDAAVPPYYFEYQLYPVDHEGTDYIGIAQDVTQAYEREDATRNAMEMAKRSDEAKSRFLSNMSHDIRTPMNAIMNMTSFALESIDQPKKLGPYLHTIRESSEHLLHLINDVLDMSRIESGQTVVASAPFCLKAEVQRQVDMVMPLCQAHGQTLIADFNGLRTETVCGDALKLSQIIMNLLSNAVKFTPEKGAVRFTATEIPSLRPDIVDVRLVIEDNGIGISAENIRRIFEPFCRANDKRVSKIEGTGLGLSICKNYVDAMGGTISCESEEGEGSIFTVELFFQKADAAPNQSHVPAVQDDTPFLGLHCLVVEDNAVNQTIAKTLLERLGFIVDLADDGSEGVFKFLKAAPDTYDVIYMDIQMPVLDGYQTAIKIRSSDHPQAKTIPIVAMTANVFPEDIEKARVAGMDAYLGKPIVSFQIIEQTRLAIGKQAGAPVGQ